MMKVHITNPVSATKIRKVLGISNADMDIVKKEIDKMTTSSQITCKCGKQMVWVEDKKFTFTPCPECGRRYKGKYNSKTLTIDAVEVKQGYFNRPTIIRNKKPYWGEAFKRIVDEDDMQYYCQQGPGKYGWWDNPKHREIIFKWSFKYFRRARWYEVIYLTALGWIVEKLTYDNN